jgi:polyamine oxidase
MTTYQKIFIMFDEQFWGPEQYMMYADPDQRGRYTVWQNINAPGFFPQGTTANLVMVTAIDDFARRNEKLTDDEVKKEVYQILKEMYGNDIPKPTDILVPRWTLDPLYRGTYSNWPIGATDQHHDNLGAPVGSGNTWLHFSGEAMSAELFGYVQGAWDEGLNAATTVAACLGGKCPTVDVFEAVTTCAQTATEFTRRDVGTKRKGMLARRGGRRNRK